MIVTPQPLVEPRPVEASNSAIRWQEVPCPLCGSPDWNPWLEAPDPNAEGDGLRFQVACCSDCGLKYTNPRPAPESIGRFYTRGYRPHRRPAQIGKRLKTWYPFATLRGRAGERRSLAWRGQGRLLDFGCGGGSYLARMTRQGWKVVGLDTSADAAQGVREELGLEVFEGTLPHPSLKPQTFDVVTMWHSLEHVHEPLKVLGAAYELLAPGGQLLVAVPNVDSWPYRLFGREWFGLDLPRHLTHFDPRSLSAMVRAAGFRVTALKMLRHADWLRSSARLARTHRPESRAARLLSRKPLARIAASICYLAGRSDCMMVLAERPG